MNFTQILEALAALQIQVQELQASNEAALQAKYDEGYAAGVASVSGGLFTQEQVDALVAAAVAPLQEQVSALEAIVAALQADVDLKISEAVAAAKAELSAQVEALLNEHDAKEDADEEELKTKAKNLFL